jgi:hypothetical protein
MWPYNNKLMHDLTHIFSYTGVDLGRTGEICIIQLSTTEQVYLFDVYQLKKDDPLTLFIKQILESNDIIKIIHDVKMDSDALYHLLDINVAGIHDTQCWDSVLYHGRELNLNKTLSYYSCTINVVRDSSIYDENFRFWATRPMTKQMKEWASADVKSLFELSTKQYTKASEAQRSAALNMSIAKASFLKEKITAASKINGRNMGRFIGTGGSNLKSFIGQFPGSFIQFRGRRGSGDIDIYAVDEAQMVKVKDAIKRFQ